MLGIIIGMVLLLILSYSLGALSHHKPRQKVMKPSLLTVKAVDPLTQEKVEAFLMAYFTKKDLGENRNRYKPFMTEGMYQQTLNLEEEPTNKTYQGFVVDYVYKDATIYIDDEHKTAIVTVTYTNTLLAKKDDYKEAQKNVSNTVSLKLTYTENQTGKLLLNRAEPLLLQDSNGTVDGTITLE